MGFLLRIILGAAAILLITPFAAMLAEPFYAAFLSEVGVDTSRWGKPVAMLVSQLWFQLLAAGAIGAATGAWMHWIATRFDKDKEVTETQPEYAERSVLRLQTSGKPEIPREIYQENIKHWYSFYTRELKVDGLDKTNQPTGMFHVPPDWLFIVRFENPVHYRQVMVHFFVEEAPSYLVHQQTPDSVLVWVNGPLPACEMEIRTNG